MLIKIIKYFTFTILGIIIFFLVTNLIMITSTKNNIKEEKELSNIKDVDCILVLGAGIRYNKPTPMLEDRLLTGINLYNNKISNKILASGDHMNKNYDEVNVMKDYLISRKIPSSDIFMDHAGISTYDSIYRAKHIFKAKKIIIITQKYHLYRALYIAKTLNIEAYGVASNPRIYANQLPRDIREFLARTKDFIKVHLKLKSKYLGEEILLTEDGNITND